MWYSRLESSDSLLLALVEVGDHALRVLEGLPVVVKLHDEGLLEVRVVERNPMTDFCRCPQVLEAQDFAHLWATRRPCRPTRSCFAPTLREQVGHTDRPPAVSAARARLPTTLMQGRQGRGPNRARVHLDREGPGCNIEDPGCDIEAPELSVFLFSSRQVIEVHFAEVEGQ